MTIKSIIEKGDNVWGVGNMPPINLPSGDWTSHLQTYEPQSFNYKDTDECSQLGGFISGVEIYFNWLRATNQIPASFLNFLDSNGYWNGTSYAFSEEFIGILDGTSINGNVMQSGYKIFPNVGLIPRSMLQWTAADAAKYPNAQLMDTNYYDPARITPAMLALGKQFLTYIAEFSWGWIWQTGGSVPLQTLKTALQTSPCALAVPVNVSVWNQVNVPYLGGTETDHCICGYKVDEIGNPTYPTFFTDQYQPWLKQFAAGYYIPNVIAFFITLVPDVEVQSVVLNQSKKTLLQVIGEFFEDLLSGLTGNKSV